MQRRRGGGGVNRWAGIGVRLWDGVRWGGLIVCARRSGGVGCGRSKFNVEAGASSIVCEGERQRRGKREEGGGRNARREYRAGVGGIDAYMQMQKRRREKMCGVGQDEGGVGGSEWTGFGMGAGWIGEAGRDAAAQSRGVVRGTGRVTWTEGVAWMANSCCWSMKRGRGRRETGRAVAYSLS
ncbi:hypothetical protein Tco_1310742 [Tanacetum coccineum]